LFVLAASGHAAICRELWKTKTPPKRGLVVKSWQSGPGCQSARHNPPLFLRISCHTVSLSYRQKHPTPGKSASY
jgi:hypothetical protein